MGPLAEAFSAVLVAAGFSAEAALLLGEAFLAAGFVVVAALFLAGAFLAATLVSAAWSSGLD